MLGTVYEENRERIKKSFQNGLRKITPLRKKQKRMNKQINSFNENQIVILFEKKIK